MSAALSDKMVAYLRKVAAGEDTRYARSDTGKLVNPVTGFALRKRGLVEFEYFIGNDGIRHYTGREIPTAGGLALLAALAPAGVTEGGDRNGLREERSDE